MEEVQAVLCFVFIDGKLLMINRHKPPFMGLWNAVGGKTEKGEDTLDTAVREIHEESGIKVDKENLYLLSRFTWNYDDQVSYAYVCNVNKVDKKFPFLYEEGIIDLKEIDWVLNDKNYGIIEDLRVFIEDIKKNRKRNYHLTYNESKLIKVEITGEN